MWREAPYILTPLSNLITEIILRVILLLSVFAVRCKLTPHMHYITKIELQSIYKRPRRDSYVPPWAVIFIVILLPLLFFSIPVLLTKRYMEFTQSFLAWTLALSINALITETVKLVVLRPRPDFFYRCFPTGLITKELRCTGSYSDVIEGRKSFPSGHSSFAFCSMGFLSLWLSGRLGALTRYHGNKVRLATFLTPFLVASLIGVSRCWDNHHHWEDVLIGAILGLICSYFCYVHYYNPITSELSGYSYAVTTNHCCSETSIIENPQKNVNNPVERIRV